MSNERHRRTLHKKHAPPPPKPKSKGIKRRQHSQNGKLNTSTSQAVSKKVHGPDRVQRARPKVPFSASDRVLLVGEGDFSFALSLARYYEVGAIVATSYDDAEALRQKYPMVEKTLRELLGTEVTPSTGNSEQGENTRPNGEEEWNGFSSDSDDSPTSAAEASKPRPERVRVLHGINATSLSKSHRKCLDKYAPFTKIVFNFPHTGGLSTDINRQVRANQELLVGFFNAAKPLLATSSRPAKPVVRDKSDDDFGGEDFDAVDPASDNEQRSQETASGRILVTLFEGEPYTLWNIRDLARHCGLQVIESFKFDATAYPGYQHARTIGDITTGKDRREDGKRKGAWRGEERDARCYVLGLKDEVASVTKNQKRKRDDSSDDSD